MPSRSNPNVPTSVKNRARSRKAGIKASVKSRGPVRVKAVTDPNQPVTEAKSGVHRKKTNSSKTVRKIARRSHYATKRKEIEVDEVRKAGEGGVVEMTGLWMSNVKLGRMGGLRKGILQDAWLMKGEI